MDIEKIKKMNEMSKVLQQHGMSSEEGSKVAGELNSVDVAAEQSKSELSKDYVDVLFERFSRKMAQELESMKEEIASLKSEMASRPVSQPQTVQTAEQETPQPAQPEVQQESQEQNNRQISRDDVKNGSDPDEIKEDVSVEKVFYFGNK